MKYIVLFLLTLYGCDTDTVISTENNHLAKSKKESRFQTNSYYKNMRYKEEVKLILQLLLEKDTMFSKRDPSFYSESYYRTFNPKYTDDLILKSIEGEIDRAIEDIVRRSVVSFNKGDSVNIIFK